MDLSRRRRSVAEITTRSCQEGIGCVARDRAILPKQFLDELSDIFTRDGKISRYVVYVEYAWQQPNGTWTVRPEYADRYYQQSGYFSSPQATC